MADYIYTLVRTGPEQARYKNLSLVVVPPTSQGVTITPIESLGMKGAATTDVSFDNVEVPFENVIGGEAVAKCREGDAKASIPTLERLLKDADMTLPPRS